MRVRSRQWACGSWWSSNEISLTRCIAPLRQNKANVRAVVFRTSNRSGAYAIRISEAKGAESRDAGKLLVPRKKKRWPSIMFGYSSFASYRPARVCLEAEFAMPLPYLL